MVVSLTPFAYIHHMRMHMHKVHEQRIQAILDRRHRMFLLEMCPYIDKIDVEQIFQMCIKVFKRKNIPRDIRRKILRRVENNIFCGFLILKNGYSKVG